MSNPAQSEASSDVLKIENLNYYYPGKKALEDINFAIPRGSITALVGPNGAGKTTLLRCLAGLDAPFSGKISVSGIDVIEEPRLAHTKIGYLSDDFGLYIDLQVHDVLTYVGGCHNLKDAELKTRLEWVVQTLRLENVLHQKCGSLSRGWRQRVGIALSIIHQPDVLILDEPASGLDPEARSELSGILKNLQARGMTIIVSSHILAELEEYCTAMLVLREGRIREHVSLEHHQTQQHKVAIKIMLASPLSVEHETQIQTIFAGEQILCDKDRMTIHVAATTDRDFHHQQLKKLLSSDIPVCGYVVEEISLQALYLKIAHTQENRT